MRGVGRGHKAAFLVTLAALSPSIGVLRSHGAYPGAASAVETRQFADAFESRMRLSQPIALAAELAQQRRGIQRLVAEPRGDLLARGPRSLQEQRAQAITGLGSPPPVVADLAD